MLITFLKNVFGMRMEHEAVKGRGEAREGKRDREEEERRKREKMRKRKRRRTFICVCGAKAGTWGLVHVRQGFYNRTAGRIN